MSSSQFSKILARIQIILDVVAFNSGILSPSRFPIILDFTLLLGKNYASHSSSFFSRDKKKGGSLLAKLIAFDACQVYV